MKKNKLKIALGILCLLLIPVIIYFGFYANSVKWSGGPQIVIENTRQTVLPEGVEVKKNGAGIFVDYTETYFCNSVEFLKCKTGNLACIDYADENTIVYTLHYYHPSTTREDEPFIKGHKYDTVFEYDIKSGTTRQLFTASGTQFVVYADEENCVIYDSEAVCAIHLKKNADGVFDASYNPAKIDLPDSIGAGRIDFYIQGDELMLTTEKGETIPVVNIRK